MIRMSRGLKNAVLFSSPMISALAFGTIDVYTGAQPASANDSPTGTFLGRITRDGLSWTEGATQGGLTFLAAATPSLLIKPAAHSWVLTAENGGEAGWFRFRSKDNLSVCLDGAITEPYEELFIGSPILTAGETRTIKSFQIGFYW